jgi:hypothetical protein
MDKVLIAVITDELIHHKVVGTLCQIMLANKKYEIDTCISAMRGIGEHRNMIVKTFLEGDYDYLLFIDADNPPPANVLDLIELDKPVIGLPTPIQMSPIQGLTEIFWNVFGEDDKPTKRTGQGLEEVNMVGSGVMLIRRDVLEKLENPFTTVRNGADLRIVGTDTAFCKKCKEQDIKIYTHWDYKCSHFKTIDLSTLT